MFDVLSPAKLARIRELNDTLRKTLGGGKVVMTANVAELGPEIKAAAIFAMAQLSDFNDGNDPNGEHDFGKFELGHYTFMFKIDYYDAELIGASEDPSDPKKTTRVLTLCFPGDW
jgi:hypothetical protein